MMGSALRWILVLSLACVACDKDQPVRADAAAPLGDAAAFADSGTDGGEWLTWVDFTVTGCTSFEPSVPVCEVRVPAQLTFLALAPAPITDYLWSFGDGTEVVSEASPTHEYSLPGSYTVSLTVGGAGGTAGRVRESFVSVLPSPLGGRCASQGECEPAYECVCKAGSDCPASLAAGVCTYACSEANPCSKDGVCVDLKPAPVEDPAPWQGAYCLKACQDDRECRPGFRCRELRHALDASWVKVCFPSDLLAGDGGSCKDAAGHLDPTRCASGRCVALGARGLCARSCSATLPCASLATCATFAGALGPSCLARCGAAACTSDPWLACEAPDTTGELGFSVAEPAASYCAPKRCAGPTECGSDGRCEMLDGASFCQ